MSSHAIAKMERQLAANDARIDAVLANPENWPADWEMLVMRSADLVERIVEAQRKLRERSVPQPAAKAA